MNYFIEVKMSFLKHIIFKKKKYKFSIRISIQNSKNKLTLMNIKNILFFLIIIHFILITDILD